MIQVLNFKTEKITGILENKTGSALYWNDLHRKSLKNNEEYFNFTMQANVPAAEHFAKQNRVIIPDEDGAFVEFIIQDTAQFSNRTKEVRAIASYTELAKQKILDPTVLEGQTINTAADYILVGTEWQRGITEYTGLHKVEFTEHTNALQALRQIASLFNLELRFRIETRGSRVIGRYVDFLKRVGMNRGKEIVLGKDLIGVTRKENTLNLVTALICLGPEREDGTRFIVRVEDKEALERWGRNGRHLWDVYTPDSTESDMTEERLTQLGHTELRKRINASVQYEVDAASLEHIFEFEHERVFLGDSSRVKDTSFVPPLYLDSRIISIDREVSTKGKKKYILGEFIEYKAEDIMKTFRALKAVLQQKASSSDIQAVREYVVEKAAEAEDAAKEYAETVILVEAKEYTNTAVSESETEIRKYVDEQIHQGPEPPTDERIRMWIDTTEEVWILKRRELDGWKPLAPVNASDLDAFTKEEVNQALEGKVSTIDYDMDTSGIIARLETAESTITQQATQIQSKVSQSAYNIDIPNLTNRMQAAETSITQQAAQISQKVSQTDYNGNTIASLINQTATTIKMRAERIEFDGAIFGKNATFSGDVKINTADGGFISIDDENFISVKKGTSGYNWSFLEPDRLHVIDTIKKKNAEYKGDGFAFYDITTGLEVWKAGMAFNGSGVDFYAEAKNIMSLKTDGMYYQGRRIWNLTDGESSRFLWSNANWNDINETGHFRADSNNNGPGGNHIWKYMNQYKHDNSWSMQEITDFDMTRRAIRGKINGNWSNWRYVPMGTFGTVRCYQYAGSRMRGTVNHNMGSWVTSVLATLNWIPGAVSLSYLGVVYVENITSTSFDVVITNMSGQSIPAGSWIDAYWQMII